MKKININDKEYPERLKEINDPPKKIYVEGNLELLNKPSIAIVGARMCDNYGISQAKRFASYLSQKRICIISGLARGIDTIAHQYSKDKTGKTIAVIASGFNYIYPEENKRLYEEIINNGGCVITEWEPNVPVEMHRFPRRNRIISGLALGTLVIEARYRSGSEITAHYAMKQKREVFAIPGNVDSIISKGTNNLISEGANLVTSPQEIIDILQLNNSEIENIHIETEYKEIFNEISEIPISANEIARRTKKTIIEINQTLFMLELDGFIEKAGLGKYIRKQN